LFSGIITELSAASEDFTCCTASTGAIRTVYTLFISEADVDRVDTTGETLLLSILQAETVKL
jgi:hypothetical protein